MEEENRSLRQALLEKDQDIERERRGREEAERRAENERREKEEARRRADEERRHADEERRRREDLEETAARTDFATFLGLCHNLTLQFKIETNPQYSATPYYTKVDGKYYPLNLQPWTAFPDLRDQCLDRLAATLGSRKYFPSPDTMNHMEEFMADEPAADESDVKQFDIFAVSNYTKAIVQRYLALDKERAGTTTRVRFVNGPYGLRRVRSMSLEHDDAERPAYMPAMFLAQQSIWTGRSSQSLDDEERDGTSPPTMSTSITPSRLKLYPDQWCFRVDQNDVRVPIFVVEYKAAHNLLPGIIRTALASSENGANLFRMAMREHLSPRTSQDQDVKDVVKARKATARVLTQAFHYMVEFGLRYSYVMSGEAWILLMLDPDDPRTLYYHLGIPRDAVANDGDAQGHDQYKNARETAVALVLAMVLLALDTSPLSQSWKQRAENELKTWGDPYSDIELSSAEQTSDEGEDRHIVPSLPPPDRPTYQGVGMKKRRRDGDGDDDDFKPTTGSSTAVSLSARPTRILPQRGSRAPGSSAGGAAQDESESTSDKPVEYCTQACLLSLRDGGPLDLACPNVRFHYRGAGPLSTTTTTTMTTTKHALSVVEFTGLLRQQLAVDLDVDCEAMDKFGKYGAIGVMFRLVLRDYGYCIVAKGVQGPHLRHLQHEERIYEHLRGYQGQLVPVCLGVLDLVREYITFTGAHITHMLLMSYCGEPFCRHFKARAALPADIQRRVEDVSTALRQAGVEHGDEREPNIVWNASLQQPMFVDFDWAELKPPPKPKEEQRGRAKRPRASGLLDSISRKASAV